MASNELVLKKGKNTLDLNFNIGGGHYGAYFINMTDANGNYASQPLKAGLCSNDTNECTLNVSLDKMDGRKLKWDVLIGRFINPLDQWSATADVSQDGIPVSGSPFRGGAKFKEGSGTGHWQVELEVKFI